MFYINVVIVLDFIYKETILSSNSALESFNYFKDYNSVFINKRKSVKLPVIFIFNRQKIFITVIASFKYKQVLSDTLK
jgi:hypothetical protein